MSKNLFPVPISFHIFNRPETTRKVFEQIRNIKPNKLFITSDGPRENVAGENEKCREVRSIVEKIDWECEVFTNFSKSNKGSYKSTSGGITWVFKYVDRAIILEDDCIPHQSFFRFCHELLDYYENDKRIALISGNTFLFGRHNTKNSYYFSRNTHMWGWATWKRTWDQVDFAMANWSEFRDMGGLDSIFKEKHESIYWQKIMQNMFDGKIGPHWDYLLLLSMYMNNALAIRPSVNLIHNTGHGVGATHFGDKMILHEVECKNMDFPLKHPPFLCRDMVADEITDLFEFSRGYSGGHSRYIKNRIINILPKVIVSFLILVKNKYKQWWIQLWI
ncbi:MAG: glycosyltransferase family 2 protein [Candidatus Brocadiaceae bacterium]|nr:glycosyltransferase family 2 protein [Candidatus Brocadiaceae bacterium]